MIVAQPTTGISEGASRVRESSEIRPLTGIRGVAALMVVLFHFHSTWTALLPGLGVLTPFARRGHLGVDLFFILSGFIICYVHKPGEGRLGLREYFKFLALRLARVYPNHIATLGLLMCMVGFAHLTHSHLTREEYVLGDLPLQLTLTHSWPWLQDHFGYYWNYPSWSISCEWFAYLFVFPVCWLTLRRNWNSFVFLGIAGASLLAWVVLQSRVGDAVFLSVSRVVCEFAAGAALFRAWWVRSEGRADWSRIAPWACVALLAVLMLPSRLHFASSIATLLFPLVLLGLTSENSWAGKFLATPIWVWLGNISYALYMSHALIQKAVKLALPSSRFAEGPLWLRGSVVLVELVALIGSAAALYYLVELPSRNYLRRMIKKRLG